MESKKIIKITGASSGIGEAIAYEYLRLGHTVCISGTSLDKLNLVKNNVVSKNYSGKLHIFQEDVRDMENLEKVYHEICNFIGYPDIVYLNAGYSQHTPIKNFNPEIYRKICDINYMGTINALKPVLDDMMHRKTGHILVTGSVAGYRGLPTATAYCATKAALNNLCEGLISEAKAYNIKIQLICPGFVKTPLTDKNKFPMPFLTTPDKIASYIVKQAEKNCYEIVYPRFFGFIMRFFRLLPNSIVQFLNNKMLKQ